MKRGIVLVLALCLFAALAGCAGETEPQPEYQQEYGTLFDAEPTAAPVTPESVMDGYRQLVRGLQSEYGVSAGAGADGLLYGRLYDGNGDGLFELALCYYRGGQARVSLYSSVGGVVTQLLDTRAGLSDDVNAAVYFCGRYLIRSESDETGEHLFFYQVRDEELVTLEYQTYAMSEDPNDVGYTLDGMNIDGTTYRSFVDLYWNAPEMETLTLPALTLTKNGTAETVSLDALMTALGL